MHLNIYLCNIDKSRCVTLDSFFSWIVFRLSFSRIYHMFGNVSLICLPRVRYNCVGSSVPLLRFVI